MITGKSRTNFRQIRSSCNNKRSTAECSIISEVKCECLIPSITPRRQILIGSRSAPATGHTNLNEQIRSNLQSVFRDDLILRGADLETSVDDETITLTGTVQNYRQHQRALELISPYINERSVEGKVIME